MVWAQVETTTSITGAVADQQGAVFPGAMVKLANQNTGAIRETVTNSDGVEPYAVAVVGQDDDQRYLWADHVDASGAAGAVCAAVFVLSLGSPRADAWAVMLTHMTPQPKR
jgi:hypothetical protein